MNWIVLGAVAAALSALRFFRPKMIVWALAWLVGIYVVLRWGFDPPIPRSAIQMYMGITLLSLIAYVTSSRERTREVVEPVVRLVTDRRRAWALVLILTAIPCAAAYGAYRAQQLEVEPPFFGRTVHPSPPTSVNVNGKEVDLVRSDNPYRHLEQTDPDAFRAHVENGRRVYFENCLFCHGDGLAGDGLFAHGLNPVPTNFVDPTVLPNFQETFFFWRIAKGGPGLPDEGGPWDSAMPRWEQFLSEEEIWDVILFLYDFTGYRPRAREEHLQQEQGS